MPKTVRDVPPPLELLCLNALWSLSEGNVKEVQQVVCLKRPLAYTTIMTVLDRLVRKGLLARRKAGRAFVYIPQIARDAMRRIALHELIDAMFDGSEQELIRFLTIAQADVPPRTPVPPAPADPKPPGENGETPIDTVLL